MGIFSRKTRQNSIPISPPLPKMPNFNNSDDLPEFPDTSEDDDSLHYEPTIADIKNEVGKDEEDEEFEIPEAESRPTRRDMSPKRELSDKPIFVKIDTYKEVLHNIDMLKVKINDAEEILRNLEDVRTEEEEKLTQWKKDLQDIKEKLLSIDSELFEV